MKKWITGVCETPFFFGLVLGGVLLLSVALILVPWALGFEVSQMAVNVALLVGLLSTPSALILPIVRPVIESKPYDMAFPAWIGRMYNTYYTVTFRIWYSVLNTFMLMLIVVKLGDVYDIAIVNQTSFISMSFAVLVLLLSALYRDAIENSHPLQSTN